MKPLSLALVTVLWLGCYWQKYHDLVRTHVEVLTSYAVRVEDMAKSGGKLEARDLTELRYPYDRARDFARIVRDRFGETHSFRRFGDFLDVYGEILNAADRLRTGGAQETAAGIEALVQRLHRAAAEVLEAARAEKA